MVNEYWIARRGMAYGILCHASGVSGAAMPFVVQVLLAKYGYQATLRAVAVGLAIATRPLIPFLDGRLPPSQHATSSKINWSFFQSPVFWFYSVSNLFQGFGYFFPALYLPSNATSLELGERSGAILLAMMSVSQVAGQFVFGYLSDGKVRIGTGVRVDTSCGSHVANHVAPGRRATLTARLRGPVRFLRRWIHRAMGPDEHGCD
ncbi:hypothetical protein RB599_004858 [Gaeumannomyces hyphopodioides]